MTYRVLLAKPAARTLERVDAATARRIRSKLRSIAADPYNIGLSKPLTGVQDLRSARVGSWRVLFSLDDAHRTVYVVAIRPRGAAYRRL